VRTQLLFRGEAGPRAPRCPLEISEHAGKNEHESSTEASPEGDLGIHTSGPGVVPDKSQRNISRHYILNNPEYGSRRHIRI